MKEFKMYFFVDPYRPNPLCGSCLHDCLYCYVHGRKGLKNRFPRMKEKYNGPYRFDHKVFNKKIINHYNIVFFCDSIDYLCNSVPDDKILYIWEWIEKYPFIRFLSLTKNPRRYLDLKHYIPDNLIIGATIESNFKNSYSKSPDNPNRIKSMIDIANDERLSYFLSFISIEPILNFYLYDFYEHICKINPNYIAIGYDNYRYKLDEPSLADTKLLIEELRQKGFIIIEKTLRKAWWEK